MRVAQVIGKLAAAGVEAVVNNYYCSMNTERIQFDYFIDEDSELAPPQEMIDRGARYFVLVLFAGCIWPLTFRWFGKWGKQRA